MAPNTKYRTPNFDSELDVERLPGRSLAEGGWALDVGR
jgi:hypothetical protein